ncbi:MAG: MotA/TolQ/ExbB proton channel family protein [Sulfurimonas sp.]|nr:MotA/TolQ/ExbB proton channel family protein [Sulfurimonas sp.]
MESLITLFNQFNAYMNSGGALIMYPLFILVFTLWYGMGYRYHTIQRGTKKSIRVLVRKFATGKGVEPRGFIDSAVVEGLKIRIYTKNSKTLRQLLDDAFYSYRKDLSKYKNLVKTVVVVAPLIGLLGTVIGMIETFDSLSFYESFLSKRGNCWWYITSTIYNTAWSCSSSTWFSDRKNIR